MSGAKRIAWADSLKGILIVLVVLGHAIQAVMKKQRADFTEDYLWNLIYSFHMPAFMAVSGFVAYRKVMAGANLWLPTIGRRFRQLMIPFLIWSVALLFVNHNVEHYYEYLLYPQKSLWFLWALFFIVVIFTGVETIARKIELRHEVAMILCWMAQIGVMFVMPNAKLLGVEYVAYYFIYYAVGYYLHKYDEILMIKNNGVLVVLGVLWFALGSIYSTQGLPEPLKIIPVIPHSLLYMVYRLFTALVAIWFLFGACEKIFNVDKGLTLWAIQLGKVLLGIYAVHMVVRFRLVDGLVFVFPQMSYWPLMLLTFTILLPVSYLFVWLFSKNRWTAEILLGKLQ